MDNPDRSAQLRIVSQDSAGMSEDSRRSKQLFRLFGVFNTEPGGDQDRCVAFIEGLADLSPAEFDRAIAETLRYHRSSFLPTPGEIRGHLERAIAESPPVGSLARPDCPKCWGTGFTIVKLSDSTYAVAVRCKCLGHSPKAA